jgi:hypothetical protein
VASSSLIAPGGKWDDAHLDALRQVGDPPADAVMQAVVGDGPDAIHRATAQLLQLVGDDLPPPGTLDPALEAFLDSTYALPEWADPALIERGQRLFEQWGPQIVLSLFCASLPAAYAAAKGVRVLHLTGRLDTDFERRIMETGQFLVDVLQPGGLEDGAVGRRSIQRVRLMHATIRALIAQRAAATPGMWDAADWGVPVNQEDLAGTLQSFAYVVGEPLPRLGIKVPRRDADAYIHLWDVIGNQLGVRPELQPQDLGEATQLVTQIRRRQQEASPAGREMGEALVAFLEGLVPGRAADEIVPTVIRHLSGQDVGDMIGVPRGIQVPGVLVRLVYLLTFRSKLLRGGQRWLQDLSEDLSREIVGAGFRVQRFGTRQPFSLPDHLARTWQLPG